MTFEKNEFSGVLVCLDFNGGVLKGKMRTGLWVTWTRMVGRGGIVSSKIVRVQKALSLLTTKRLCSKSGVVNDRKVRDRVDGVD